MNKYLTTLIATSLMASAPIALTAKEITLISEEGKNFSIDVSNHEPFFSVIEQIEKNLATINESESPNGLANPLNFYVMNDQYNVSVAAKNNHNGQRNFYAPLTKKEKEDLHYILDTLARSSLVKIAKMKSSLKKAGDRIDHLHPLRFVTAIFTDEELKADIHAVQGRGWVWAEFRDNLVDSFNKEARVNNLTIEYLQHFANAVGVDINYFVPSYTSGNWSEFLNDCIRYIPRTGETDRYRI